jgi:RNA polymerase sigma-70 factor (ECF subfamily)
MELDRVTLERARRGDARALAALVRCHEARVFGIVARMVPNERPEDLAQEVFLKVLRHLGRFDPDGPAALSTWITTIAMRTCLDGRRTKRPVQVELEESLVERRADPEQEAGGRELGRRVEAAISALPADQRAVLVLRAYSDLDYPEIARALEIEEGTVKSRLNRARAALKQVLEGGER